jgi:iduronate 2-sulfatase
MRRTLSMLFLGVQVAFATNAGHAADGTKKLNVLFILTDDMRPDLGCYGNTMVKSPNIDALAKVGMRFDRAYCQYPLCNPSRSSLLTGRYPTTTGVLDNLADVRKLHPDWVTLPEHFKKNGYSTLRSGKIFHGGLDDQQSWTDGAEPARKEGVPPKPVDVKARQRQSDQIVKLKGDGESHNDFRTAEKAIEYLQHHKDKPFFLACGFTKPHSPPTAPEKYFGLYDASKIPLPPNFAARPTVPTGFPKPCLPQNGDVFIGRDASEAEAREMIRAYWSSISWVDWNIGRVLAELDKQGLRDNTIVLFWGDHGYHLGEMGKWSKHGSLFEVGTRVPLIVSVPGMTTKGKAVSVPVQTLDLYPTLCELCGLAAPSGLQGHSLKPLLNDPQAKWEHPAFTVAGNVKNLGVAVRTNKYRYAEWNGGENGAMLFDVNADPHELKNLADDPRFADVRKELASLVKPIAKP